MNYLAHLLLSFDNEGLMIGNFIGDAVKGKQYLDFPREISKGVTLHRSIDAYSDGHEAMLKSKRILSPEFGHFSAVILDVYSDYILANKWKVYCNDSLEVFTKKVYAILKRNLIILPEKSRIFYEYMIKYDILMAYRDKKGIERVLQGISRRTKFDVELSDAVKYLDSSMGQFEENFTAFFPQIIDFVNVEKERLLR